MKPTTRIPRNTHHREEAEPADLLQHDRPREKKRDLEIEQDEENRDQVVAHVEFHARVLESLEPALVRRELLRVGPMHAEQPARARRPSAIGATPIAAPTTMNIRIGK